MATNKTELRTLEKTTPETALALALEIYDQQGFIRSGDGFYKQSQDGPTVYVYDNKTILIKMLVEQAQPSEENLAKAKTIINDINGKFMIKKLTNNMNSFETAMAEAFAAQFVSTKYRLAVIASVPHMATVDAKRQQVEAILESVQFISKHVGEVKERYDLEVEVVDVKYIQSTGVFMITTLHQGADIVKFWWREQPDLTDMLQTGQRIRVRGTVIRHEHNRQNKAAETMINRVKLVNSAM